MQFIRRIKNRLDHYLDRLHKSFRNATEKVVIPGKTKTNLYLVVMIFIRGMRKSSINLRAGAISFSFTLAVFPGLMFMLALLPIIPVPNLQETIIQTLEELMPQNAFHTIQSVVIDTLANQRIDLLSLGFLFSVYFASEGFMMIMSAFNQSSHAIENRSGFKRRVTALFLVLVIAFTLIVSGSSLIFTNLVLDFLISEGLISIKINFLLVYAGQWIVLFAMALFSFSLIYYLAPAKRGSISFFSVGSITASVLVLVATRIFTFFIENFGQYNKIYGSLGTLLIIAVWLNINALVLLVGYELNASIYEARQQMEDDSDEY